MRRSASSFAGVSLSNHAFSLSAISCHTQSIVVVCVKVDANLKIASSNRRRVVDSRFLSLRARKHEGSIIYL